MTTAPSKTLEVVPKPHPDRDYEVAMTVPEFTCLCPRTGQPDFATIRIRYVPDQHLVELKSLKLYLWSYRQQGAFHEDVTNRILDDLVAAIRPRWAEVIVDGNVRVEVSPRKRSRLEPGEYFGEMSLRDGGPRSASVIAETPLRLLVIKRRDFNTLLREAPELTQSLLATLSRRLRHAEASLT